MYLVRFSTSLDMKLIDEVNEVDVVDKETSYGHIRMTSSFSIVSLFSCSSSIYIS